MSALDPGGRLVERGAIRCGRLTPHSELKKHVCRHVAGVARVGRERGQAPRGGQPLRGMIRIVVVVNQIVQRAGVIRVCLQHAIEDRRDSRLHRAAGQSVDVSFVGIFVADQAARHRAEQREGIQRGDVGIVRILLVGAGHRRGVLLMAGCAVALAEERVGGIEQVGLGWSGRPVQACRAGRAQAPQGVAAGGRIFFTPQDLVVGHRFAPERHRQRPVGVLGAPERVIRVLVFEQMKGSQSAGDIVGGGIGSPIGRICAASALCRGQRGLHPAD